MAEAKSKSEALVEAAKELYPELSDFSHNGSYIVAKNDKGQVVFTHEDIIKASLGVLTVAATPKP